MGQQRSRSSRKRRHRSSSTAPEVFNAESPERAFLPWADVFKSTVSLKTARRALAVKAGFLEGLITDPRILGLFHRWLDQLGADSDSLTTDDAWPLLHRELGVRWPWCLVDVLETFHRMVQLKIGDPIQALPPSEAGVLAPPMVVGFEIEEGEGTDEARARWEMLSKKVTKALDAAEAAVAGGNFPKSEEQLRAWGRWFYETWVKQEPTTITEIAQKNHKDRKTVRDAINEAERLLNLIGSGGKQAAPSR